MALTLKNGGLTVKQTINGIETTGTGVKGVASARGGRGGPRSGPAEGGTAGTVDSVSPSSFAISTPADVMVTIETTSSTTYRQGTSSISASAVTKGESVVVLGTVNLGAAKLTTITASQVIVQPVGEGGSATPAAASVVPFQRGAPSAGKQVGQIPANYIQGAGTIVGGTEANKATVPALAAYPGASSTELCSLAPANTRSTTSASTGRTTSSSTRTSRSLAPSNGICVSYTVRIPAPDTSPSF